MQAVATNDAVRLRSALADAHSEIKELRRTVASKARLLSLLAPETSPCAPSLNAVYWLYAPTKWHSKSWPVEWRRIRPSLDALGEMLAPDITPVVWEGHRARRRASACEHTINIELGRLKTLLDWAVANEMIRYSPLSAATYVKTKSRRETSLKSVDVDALLIAAEDLTDRRRRDGDDDGRRSAQLRAFVLLCFDEMLRFDEARRFRRDAIDANGDAKVTGKGDKTRIVHLTPRTLEAIAAVPSHPDTCEVFVDPDTGARVSDTTMRTWFKWACKHGGLNRRAAPGEPRIVPHHLRHSGASIADEKGVRPGALQTMMGHASLATTERYVHREGVEAARHVAAVMVDATRSPPQRARKRNR